MSDRLLVLDTATRQPVLGLAGPDGELVGERRWESRRGHGERLIQELDGLLEDANLGAADLSGVVVGIGPGSFTGLRIGLATAKVLAYSLGLPLAGVPTTLGLAMAAAAEPDEARIAVALPAGAADVYVAVFGMAGGEARELAPAALVADRAALAEAAVGARLVAVDMASEAVSPSAVQHGRAAQRGLAAALAGEGARRLAAGQTDDPYTLVPAYVALPRGVQQSAEDIRWSPDLR